MDIWQIVLETTQRQEATDESQEDKTLLFVGNRKAGKTTLIYRFLSRDEPPKPTLAMEYTFGRQSRTNMLTKDVCHIWELGGGTLFTSLLEIPISTKTLANLAVILMLDLSEPSQLLITLENQLYSLRRRIDQVLDHGEAKRSKLKDSLLAATWKRLGNDHQDHNLIKPFPAPLLIIGGKYDLFQNFEPEQRKIMCRTLRYFAHLNGASLHFFSAKMDNLVNRTRLLLSNLAFGTAVSNFISQDYNKPLAIPAGSDSFEQIGSSIQDVGKNNAAVVYWKKEFESHFPQVDQNSMIPDDPAKDPNFKETVIDDLRKHKDEDLERYRKELLLKHQDDEL